MSNSCVISSSEKISWSPYDQPRRQEAVVAVLQDAHRAVALGELGAVRAEDHRHVRVQRWLDA
jgi:hypothetical protein